MSESQQLRILRELKKRKVKNWEFARHMYILSHTKRLAELRAKGHDIQKERVYDNNGKATGVFEYWIA